MEIPKSKLLKSAQAALTTLVLIFLSAKISFLYLYLTPGSFRFTGYFDYNYLFELFVRNGLPLILVWVVAGRFLHRGWLLVVLILFTDLFCFVFMLKFRNLQDSLRYSDLLEFFNALGVASTSFSALKNTDYLYLLDLPVPILTWKYLSEKKPRAGYGLNFLKRQINLSDLGQGVFIVCAFCSAVYVYSYNDAYAIVKLDRSMVAPWEPGALTDSFRNYGPLYSFSLSGRDYYKNKYRIKKLAPGKEAVLAAVARMSSEQEIKPLIPGRLPFKPNVVMVLEESMGRASVDPPVFKKAGIQVTPFLNSLRDELFFSSHILSPVRGGETCEAEFMVLNSCYTQPDKGIVYTSFMGHEYNSLARILKANGYYTAVFHSNKREFWHRAVAYEKMGFERYDSEEDFFQREDDIVNLGLSDKEFFRQVTKKLKGLPQPFFALVITLSGHANYKLPQELKCGLTANFKELPDRVADYIECMHYTDEALRGFWTDISDLREKSIFVVFGDHQGLITEAELKSLGYDVGPDMFYEVPLVISAPFCNNLVKKSHDMIGDEADIAPTVLDLLNIPKPPYYAGESLFRGKNSAMCLTSCIEDGSRRCEINKGSYYMKKGGNLDKKDCVDLINKAQDSDIVSKDILWGSMYSYGWKTR